ncbi:MAG: formate dehydrogenase [Hyphomicrobiales bacterium]|nr:formate dehydrogenase [Hyphomicrobiales bacterium]
MSKNSNSIDRRTALQVLGGGTAVAVGTTIPLADDALAYDPGREETRARYRETEHVKAFYRTNGYETLKK